MKGLSLKQKSREGLSPSPLSRPTLWPQGVGSPEEEALAQGPGIRPAGEGPSGGRHCPPSLPPGTERSAERPGPGWRFYSGLLLSLEPLLQSKTPLSEGRENFSGGANLPQPSHDWERFRAWCEGPQARLRGGRRWPGPPAPRPRRVPGQAVPGVTAQQLWGCVIPIAGMRNSRPGPTEPLAPGLTRTGRGSGLEAASLLYRRPMPTVRGGRLLGELRCPNAPGARPAATAQASLPPSIDAACVDGPLR